MHVWLAQWQNFLGAATRNDEDKRTEPNKTADKNFIASPFFAIYAIIMDIIAISEC